METTKEEIVSLIGELKTAAKIYYIGEKDSPLTDEEFDLKMELLESHQDNFPDLFKEGTNGYELFYSDPSLGTSEEYSKTVFHASPMLSLGKAKSSEELSKFITKTDKNGAKNYKLQAKLDGFALSVTYNNGKIEQIATRGDGIRGQNLNFIKNDKNLTIKGLPQNISSKDQFEVRGEVFFTTEQFKKVNSSRFKETGEYFKNSRNACSGLIRKSEKGLDYPVEMTFSAYSTFDPNGEKTLETIKTIEINTVDETTLNEVKKLDTKFTLDATSKNIMEKVERFGELRENFGIPTDGVVIKPKNEQEMLDLTGYTSHHPVSQIAYKYPSVHRETYIRKIDVTVGKTGRLTPIARLDPVEFPDSVVSNVTLNNFVWMEEKGVTTGAHISLVKSNEIIPKIVAVLKSGIKIKDDPNAKMPSNCPVCSGPITMRGTEGKIAYCENLNCPSRRQFALTTAVSKNLLDIDGMSTALVEQLSNDGILKDVSDLYTLTKKELEISTFGKTQKTLGSSTAQRIVDSIERSKTLPLYKLLASIGIPGMGISTAKKLSKKFPDIDYILKLTKNDLMNEFGEKTAEELYTGIQNASHVIQKMKNHGVKMKDEDTTSSQNNSNNSVSFSISGSVPEGYKNRQDFIDKAESKGHIFHSSPKTETNIMIGDKEEKTSKIVKAIKNGTTILSPEEFQKKYMN